MSFRQSSSSKSKANRHKSSLRIEPLERREVMAGDAWPNMENVVPRGTVNQLYESHFMLAGDFDGNKLADVAYIHKETGNNRVVFNRGNGEFEKKDNFFPVGAVNQWRESNFVVAGDFDGNGRTDVLAFHKQTGASRVVLTPASGQFVIRDNFLPAGAVNNLNNSYHVLAGDFDKNGLADVALIHKETGWNRLVVNQGNGKFVTRDETLPRGAINQTYDKHVMLAGDFDGNGYADVMFIHRESGFNRMVLNQGFGRFTHQDNSIQTSVVNQLYTKYNVVAGDFNGDRDAELLYVHKNSGENRMLGAMFTDVWFGGNTPPWHRNDGVLTITGTEGNDHIVISETEWGTRIDMNGGWGVTRKGYTKKIVVYAGPGDDYVRNDTGISSELFGQDGNDELDGGGNSDLLAGGAGDDSLFGRSGSDVLLGREGNDWLAGGIGVDFLGGGEGDDNLDGGFDTDFYVDLSGRNRCYFGAEDDLVSRAMVADVSRSIFFPRGGGNPTSGEDFGGGGFEGEGGTGGSTVEPEEEDARERAEELLSDRVQPQFNELNNRILNKSDLGQFREEMANQPALINGAR